MILMLSNMLGTQKSTKLLTEATVQSLQAKLVLGTGMIQ